MASVVCGRARQCLQKSSSTKNAVVSKLFGNKSSTKIPAFSPSNKPTTSSSHFSPHRLFTSSSLPVELRCVQSLLPLHSANASALFTSLLSLHAQSWGALSEGFATPL
ncbi:hypothetical protein vseg_020027 [Gypsophila vaccaria]